MARSRSISPGFFRHRELFEAERESGLPLRVAYAGLWCAADREGRFRWRPWDLKLDVLPYEDVDFGAVLTALETAGFLRRYVVADQVYGVIPQFTNHQRPHPRESPSKLPSPPEGLPPDNLKTAEGNPFPSDVQAFGCSSPSGRRMKGHAPSAAPSARPPADAIPDTLTPEARDALTGMLTASPNPAALLAEVRAILTGMRPGTPADPALVSRALVDLQLAGAVRPTGKQLRAFVLGAQREAAPRPVKPPATSRTWGGRRSPPDPDPIEAPYHRKYRDPYALPSGPAAIGDVLSQIPPTEGAA
jgi:hypothetical protein